MCGIKNPGKIGRLLKCTVSALSLIFVISQCTDILGYPTRTKVSSSSKGSQSSSSNKSQIGNTSNKSSSFSSSKNNTEENDTENYPFEKSQGTVTEDQVCGMRIKEDKIILLTSERTFSELQRKKDEDADFTDVNLFRQYPNLLNVELSNLTLTDAALENLQTFLPDNLKMLIIDSCKISKTGYPLLAKLIEEHQSLTSLRIRMYSAKANQTKVIINSLAKLADLKYIGLGFGKISEKSLGELGDYIGDLAELKDISLSWMGIAEDSESDEEGNEQSEGQSEEQNENNGPNCYNKLLTGFSKVAPELTGIEFAFIELPEQVTEDLFTELNKCLNVNKLTLWIGNMNKYGNVATNECALRLGDAVTKMKKLANLDISCMGLNASFMNTFASCYTINEELTALNISGNVLDEDASEALGESLKEATKLQILLANDCSIENKAVGNLFKNLGNSSLKCICLNRNKLKEGVKQIPIKTMLDLQGIDLSNNEMTGEEVTYVADNAPENLKLVKCDNNTGIKAMSSDEKTELRNHLENKKMEGQKVGFLGI